MARKRRKPRCIVIGGPNGAGKTTFARDYLPAIARLIHFVNVDLIAGGISPLRPELAAVTAGRVVLRELDRLAAAKADFAFESTLSGLLYAKRMKDWKTQGFSIEINYIRLPSPQLALRRIAARVKQGGHNVPRADVLRRYKRSYGRERQQTGGNQANKTLLCPFFHCHSLAVTNTLQARTPDRPRVNFHNCSSFGISLQNDSLDARIRQ